MIKTDTNFQVILSLVLFVFLSTNIFAKEKEIVLATDAWAPYYGPDIKNQGYFTHIVKEVFKRKGYSFKVDFVPWKRAVVMAERGKYDGILGAFYKEERTEFFEYSKPIDTAQMVFFTKKDKDIKYERLEDLSSSLIGVVRGYHYSDEFTDFKKNLQLHESTRTKDNIRLLLYNRLDLVLGSKKVTLDLLRRYYENDISKLKILPNPLASSKLYVTISKKNKNHAKIIKDFNAGLDEIKKDGTFDRILKLYVF